MSEQLTLQERLRDSRAVDRDERLITSITQEVRHARDHIFASTVFTQHKDGQLGGSNPLNRLSK